MSFPPKLGNMRDVVINQEAQEHYWALRKGSASLVIPNVFDFENPPEPVDDYASDVRQELGLTDEDFFILQPTRVVPCKGIGTGNQTGQPTQRPKVQACHIS